MLYLIGYHLNRIGIKYLRIDGSMSIKERKKILDMFKDGSEYLVLLMSIGTGCIGLNLSAASHVHLMEPQWNPMVESQALDRVYRLGQTKPVKTIRYIVKDTFEKVRMRTVGFRPFFIADSNSSNRMCWRCRRRNCYRLL
jgi:SWI/SNF-related matrix-associated actin-dependent regulator of chromatin subfamily A3